MSDQKIRTLNLAMQEEAIQRNKDAKILELEQRVKVLTDAIESASKEMTLEQNFYSRPGQILEAALNSIPTLPESATSPETDLDKALRHQ